MKTKVIAELSTYPVGEGTSLSKFVRQAINVLDNFENIRVIHHPMGTVIEADTIDQILNVTKLAHEAIVRMGAKRIITNLKIDDRRDKERKMEDKVKAVI